MQSPRLWPRLGLVLVVLGLIQLDRTFAAAPTIIPHTTIQHLSVGPRFDPQMTFHAAMGVDHVPSVADMQLTANALWANGNLGYSTFSVRFYLPGMDGDAAYAVAEFEPSGMKRWNVNAWTLRGTRWDSATGGFP